MVLWVTLLSQSATKTSQAHYNTTTQQATMIQMLNTIQIIIIRPTQALILFIFYELHIWRKKQCSYYCYQVLHSNEYYLIKCDSLVIEKSVWGLHILKYWITIITDALYCRKHCNVATCGANHCLCQGGNVLGSVCGFSCSWTSLDPLHFVKALNAGPNIIYNLWKRAWRRSTLWVVKSIVEIIN